MRSSLSLRQLLFAVVIASACVTPVAADRFEFAELADPMYRVPDRAFPDCCAEPHWWSSVGGSPIRSIEELYALWQNNDVEKRIKAKAFFQAVHDFRGRNDEIVATAIALYPNVDGKYPDLIPLLEYGVGEYFDYDGSRDHYVGPAADRSAGLVRHLARQYQKQGLHEQTVKLLAAFMTKREKETNAHLLQLISMSLAQSLDALGQTKTADRILAYAQTQDGSWDKKIADQRDQLRQKLSLFDRLPANTGYFLLVALVALAVAAGLIARRQSRPQEGH